MFRGFSVILKIICSGLIALVALTGFGFVYYNLPVREASEDGSTDYKRESNAFWSKGTEGFAYGITNNEGFFDIRDYNPDEGIDVLIIGSSNVEAYEMQTKDAMTALLDNMLSSKIVYNIGVSGHSFLTCVNNTVNAINKYHPRDYMIYETSSLSFSEESIKKILDGTYEKLPAENTGIVGLLQRNQFLRLLYAQIQSLLSKSGGVDTEQDNSHTDVSASEQLLDSFVKKISDELNAEDIKGIIIYHPSVSLREDGSLLVNADNDDIKTFKKLCDKYGLILLDMTERFKAEYYENHILPAGFSNTSVGTGHLNTYGHKMIAEELYKIIKEER